jgi:micrococcal nuclease
MGNCGTKSTKNITQVEYKETIPFIPPVTSGKVIKVYDGDTITVATSLPFRDKPETVYRFSVRLKGIDTPELRTKCPEEKQVAQLARNALAELCLGQIVQLQDVGTEKYGRLLANVILNKGNKTINLNQWMLQQRYAVCYEGGTKISPKSWLKFHQTGAI